jgi:hypothetical protein
MTIAVPGLAGTEENPTSTRISVFGFCPANNVPLSAS